MAIWKSLKKWRLDAGAATLLLFLCLLFFFRLITPDSADRLYFTAGDFSDQFFLFSRYAAERLWQGQIPLWNPFVLSGHPFLADVQSGVFYPLRLLTILLSGPNLPLVSLEWEAVLHFLLTSLFTYLFGRRLFSQRLPALASAITFAYGGYLTSYPPLQLSILEVDTWLPLILLALDIAWVRWEKKRQIFPFALAGILFGLSILPGHPQSSMYVFYTSLIYFLFRGLQDRPRWTGIVPPILIYIGIGFGLAAVQIIPGLEYFTLSTRGGAVFQELAHGFQPREFIGLLLSDAPQGWSPMYVGILPLISALWGLLKGPRRETLFWGGLALLALLLSLGGNFFIYNLFYLFVPGFGLFRSQERAVFIFSFATSILAGFGVREIAHALSRQSRIDLKTVSRSLAWATAGVLILAALIFYSRLNGFISDNNFAKQMNKSVLLFFFLAATTTLIWIRSRSLLRGKIFWTVALALVVFDLFTINSQTNLQAKNPERQYAVRGWVKSVLEDDSLFRVDNWVATSSNYGIAYALQDIEGASPMQIERYRDLFTLTRERLWLLWNVQYVHASSPLLPLPSEVVYQEEQGETSYLHRLTSPLPRAYLVYAVAVMDDETTLRRLTDPQWDPGNSVILAEGPSFALPSQPPAGEEARITTYAPERIVIDLEARANGFLALSEVFFPGWRAEVDGQETKIYRANYTQRAIPLSPGLHRVEVVYDPLSFKAGAMISLATVAAFLTWGLFFWRRNKITATKD